MQKLYGIINNKTGEVVHICKNKPHKEVGAFGEEEFYMCDKVQNGLISFGSDYIPFYTEDFDVIMLEIEVGATIQYEKLCDNDNVQKYEISKDGFWYIEKMLNIDVGAYGDPGPCDSKYDAKFDILHQLLYGELKFLNKEGFTISDLRKHYTKCKNPFIHIKEYAKEVI